MTNTTLYIGTAGYDTVALPIVVVCCKISSVSVDAGRLYNRLRTLYSAPFEDRMNVLRDSEVDYRASYIYPDEFQRSEKRLKVSKAISNVAIQQFYKHKPNKIIMSHDVPSPHTKHLPIDRQKKSSIELNIANYQAQILREPYIIKADQICPHFEFQKNRGKPDYKHYLLILKYGLTRFHHSISEVTFNKAYRELVSRKHKLLFDFYPYYKNPPSWWDEYFDTPFRKCLGNKVKNEIEDAYKYVRDYRLLKMAYGEKMAKFLAPPVKPVSPNFVKWVEDNKPKEEFPYHDGLRFNKKG